MTDHEVVEGEIVAEDTLPAVRESAPPTLFQTSDPVEVVERATRAAVALKEVIDRQKLTVEISGRAHVKVEGWTLLGSMLGVFPVTVKTERELHGDDEGWHAWVEARRPNPAAPLGYDVVGAAEATCMKSERNWKSRDDHALLSMAQTRATSKALASALRFVMELAGYATTPAEEMPSDTGEAPSQPQTRKLNALLRELKELEERNDWKQVAKEFCERHFDKSSVKDLTKRELSSLIDELEREKVRLTPNPEATFA